MRMILLASLMLTACNETAPRQVDPEPTVSLIEAVPSSEEEVDEEEPEQEEERLAIPTIVVEAPRLSPVQSAPDYHSTGFFSELPRERQEAMRHFSRTLPEEFNLRRDRQLYDITVLVLARLCFSEAGWIHDPRFDGDRDVNHAERDCPAIYQVLRRTRGTGQTLIGVIRAHTNFVAEERTPVRPRMRWITNLQLDGRRPQNMPADHDWEHLYAPRWMALLDFVRELLAGRGLGPCAGAPIITWGGRCEDEAGACDDHNAVSRGLVPYDCGDTANRFWCRPGTQGCTSPAEQPVAEVSG